MTTDEQTRSFPGSVQPDGRVAIASVPANTPYVLELRAPSRDARADDLPLVLRYPIDGARRVRFGTDHWGRQDVTQLASDEQTQLALSVTTTAAFAFLDTFSWIGLRSYFYRSVSYLPPDDADPEVSGVPEEDATTSLGWSHPASLLEAPYGEEVGGLPVAAAGDDLLLLQTRLSMVVESGRDPSDPLFDPWFDFDPWSRFTLEEAVGVLHVEGANFANHATNLVSGTLSEPASTAVTIDIQGNTFAEVRELARYPSDVRASVSLRLTQEAGTGPQVYTSVAPMPWAIIARSQLKPAVIECYPRQGTCPELCCDPSTDGYIDPGQFQREFQIPRAYAEDMRDLYVMTYAYRKDWSHPETGEPSSLYAEIKEMRPASGAQETFALELAPVTNLTLNGEPLSWEHENAIVDRTVTISFDPPALGTPEYYEVYVIELQPDAHLEGDDVARRPTRTVATLYGRETSVTIPDNVLRPGRYYSVYVYATSDGRDFTAPDIAQRETSLTAGVFSPVFYTAF